MKCSTAFAPLVATALIGALAIACGSKGGNADSPTATVADDEAEGAPCGVGRWSVKTLSDDDAGRVDTTPKPQTVAALGALPPPDDFPDTHRVAPTELQTFTVTARAVGLSLEDDGDVHMVLADLDDDTKTMIVEFPDAEACLGALTSRFAPEMRSAREALVAAYGEPTTDFMDLTGTVTVTGVGFFDFPHGQFGVAPNAIELHPVLAFINHGAN